MLKISPGELQAIQMDLTNGGDSKNFFRAMLIKWAETRRGPYTWQTILDVLSSPYIGHAPLAREIEHQLMAGDTIQPPTEGSGDVPATDEGNFRVLPNIGPYALDNDSVSLYLIPLYGLIIQGS